MPAPVKAHAISTQHMKLLAPRCIARIRVAQALAVWACRHLRLPEAALGINPRAVSVSSMRFLARIIGFLCVAGGFVALVIDGTRTIANGAWAPVALGDVAAGAFPKLFPMLQPAVERLRPFLWSPVLATVLAAPTFVVGMGLGFLLLLLGRRPVRQDTAFLAGR
jgi:hypothetical protein